MSEDHHSINIGRNAEGNIIINGDGNIVSASVPALPPAERERLTKAYLEAAASRWAYVEAGSSDAKIPLDNVYVLLQARPTPPPRPLETRSDLPLSEARAAHAGLAPEGEKAPPPPSVPIGEALQKARHLVLLGEPGAGKSTTLQFIGLCFARQAEGWPRAKLELDEARIPLRLRLPVWAERLKERPTLFEALAAELHSMMSASLSQEEAQTLLRTWVQEDRLLVLLDGLDEVPEAQRGAVRAAIADWVAQPANRGNRLVVASRLAGFASFGPPLEEYTLHPFENAAQAKPFLTRWLAALKGIPPAEAEKMAAELLERLQANPALRRLTDTPLLLRLSAEIYAATGEIARNRADLYARWVEESWQRALRRGANPEQKEAAFNALERIAWHLQNGGPADEKSLAELVGKETLTLLRTKTGLLVRHSPEAWAFAHATLREYFVAQRLKRAWERNRQRTWRFLKPRLHLPEWREPLLLLAGLLPEAEADELSRKVRHAHSPAERYLARDRLLALALEAELQHLSPLLEALHDENEDVRWAAAWGLGQIGNTAVQSLLQTLCDEDWGVRQVAAWALGQIGDPSAVPSLLKALSDEDWRVRRTAAEALGDISDTRTAPNLLKALSDTNWHVRRSTTEALGKIGDASAVPHLLEALNKDEEWDVRWAAAEALEKITVPSPPKAIYNEKENVPRPAAEMSRKIGKARTVPGLLEALQDENWRVRRAAAEALGEIRDARSVPVLIQALNDKEWWVLKAATEALGQIGDIAVPRLLEALGYENEDVRWAAAEALGQIGDARAIPNLLEALNDENEYVRSAAAEALGKIGDTSAVPAVIEALRDERWRVREAAGEALGQIGDARAVPDLLDALRHEYQDVRWRAALVLGKIGNARAIPGLLEALSDENEEVRWAAAAALGQIGDARAIPNLLEALSDENWFVRRAAAEALGQIVQPEADLPRHTWRALRRAVPRLAKIDRDAALQVLQALESRAVAASHWKDPLQPSPWEARLTKAGKVLLPLVLAGVVALLVVLQGAISKSLQEKFQAMLGGVSPVWLGVLLLVVAAIVAVLVQQQKKR